jgi:hypothetical protein
LNFGDQAVVGHRGTVARSSILGAGVVTAVDVGDGMVAEPPSTSTRPATAH